MINRGCYEADTHTNRNRRNSTITTFPHSYPTQKKCEFRFLNKADKTKMQWWTNQAYFLLFILLTSLSREEHGAVWPPWVDLRRQSDSEKLRAFNRHMAGTRAKRALASVHDRGRGSCMLSAEGSQDIQASPQPAHTAEAPLCKSPPNIWRNITLLQNTTCMLLEWNCSTKCKDFF